MIRGLSKPQRHAAASVLAVAFAAGALPALAAHDVQLDYYGKQLASGSHDATVRVWDPASGECLATLNVESMIFDIAWNNDGTKIASVRANALYILDIRAEHGSFGRFMADWPDSDFVGLWMHLKKNGTRLGGQTGRYCLRFLGYDTPLLSRDVVAALIGAGVVDKEPTSKRDLTAMQDAINTWREQSDRSAREISRLLALSVG